MGKKKELPDYYDLIRTPIDLSKIKDKIKKGRYGGFADMVEDLDLLMKNTQTYNMDGSLIYEDSVVLQTVYRDAVQSLESNGNLPKSETEEENESQPTAATVDQEEETKESTDLEDERAPVKQEENDPTPQDKMQMDE